PQEFKHVREAGLQVELFRSERPELQIRTRRLLVEIEQARQIDGPVNLEYLPGGETEVRSQALDNFSIGALLDFQADCSSFPAQMKLSVHRIQDAARF